MFINKEVFEGSDYEKLQDFKKWVDKSFKKQCEERYGSSVFSKYIFPYYDDFLECVEFHIEDLAEQHIQDEEYELFGFEENEVTITTEEEHNNGTSSD